MRTRIVPLVIVALVVVVVVVGGAACTPHAPVEPWHPCDVSRDGPQVAPPYDGREVIEEIAPADRGCPIGDAAGDDAAIVDGCARMGRCATACVRLTQVQRAVDRAAAISAGLLALREHLDALPATSPCLAHLDTAMLDGERAATLARCAGVDVELPALVISLRARHVDELAVMTPLYPHGELVTFRAARFPVDCAPPAWAVDRTPP